jgi:hypothetical protein
MNKGIGCLLILIVLFASKTAVMAQDNWCNEVMVTTKLMNWRNIKGVKKYVESGKWDSYDDNGAENPIPDKVDVYVDLNLTAYYLKHAFLPNEIKADDFEVKVIAKLKLGESTDCINVLNPTVIDVTDFVASKNVDYSSFFKQSKYQMQQIKTTLDLNRILKNVNVSGKMLNQIIINVIIKSAKKSKECVIEYMKPVLR